MIKNTLRVLFIVPIFLFLICVYLSSVVIKVENVTSSKITDIKFTYGKKLISIQELLPSQSKEINISKIGEGATFNISWVLDRETVKQESFSVYFYDYSIYTNLIFTIKNNAVTLFYENEQELIKPNGT